MGQSASGYDESSKVGYRVLAVQDDSPGYLAGLVSMFDFIVAAGGVQLDQMDHRFVKIIQANENRPLPLVVYNTKACRNREVTLVPTTNWRGRGMLGVTIRFDTYFRADERLVHVLDVAPKSPAQLAGLQAHSDYILGTTDHVFDDSDGLLDEVVAHVDSPLTLFVFNCDRDQVRQVIIVPNAEWGGGGVLGASVGHGLLHRLPAALRHSTGSAVPSGLEHFAAPDFVISSCQQANHKKVDVVVQAEDEVVLEPQQEEQPVVHLAAATTAEQ